jgi:hypothetical protein
MIGQAGACEVVAVLVAPTEMSHPVRVAVQVVVVMHD